MSDEKKISRRAALKVIAVGVGTASALPILEKNALSQQTHHGMEMGQAAGAAVEAAETPRFFTPQEMATIATIADLIIPSDEHSPGAKATGISGFIDLMVSESSNEIKALWRDGLAALDRMSQQKFSTAFNSASTEQQISLLKAVSKNERKPKTIEERFFIAIKGLTVDGYYTSAIGIHQELQYKGNAYLKEFVGCTHPEHMS
jgi:gluconate 2-dehydrogenase gamma chain